MSMDEALFVDIENALQTSDFRVVGDEILEAVEEAFLATKISVEEMADEFLTKLQTHPELDLFFREEAENFAELRSGCVSSWKEKLAAKESEVADHLIGYFDKKLTRHSHRVINIKNAMSRKVMRLRESVVQYRVGHDIKGDEKIREYNRLVVDAVREEKDAEIAELQARIGTLEDRLRVAQVSRLSDPSYRELITDRQAALDRAAVNVDDSIEAKIAQRPCASCLELTERVDDLERIVAQHDASSQESSSVMFSPDRIVRPSQIVMNRNHFGASAGDDDDDSTAADSVSVLSSVAEGSTEAGRHTSPPKKGKKSKNGQKSGKQTQRMHRASLVKVQGGKETPHADGETPFRGRQRTELTPTRQGQRPSTVRPDTGNSRPVNSLAVSELKEGDNEDADDCDGGMDSCAGTISPPSCLSAPCSVVIADASAPVELAESVTEEAAASVPTPVLDPVPVSAPCPVEPLAQPDAEPVIVASCEKYVQDTQSIPVPNEEPIALEQPRKQLIEESAAAMSHADEKQNNVPVQQSTTSGICPKLEEKSAPLTVEKRSKTPNVVDEAAAKPVRGVRHSIRPQKQTVKPPQTSNGGKTGGAMQVKKDKPLQNDLSDKIDSTQSVSLDSTFVEAEVSSIPKDIGESREMSIDDSSLMSARSTARTPDIEKSAHKARAEVVSNVQKVSPRQHKEKPPVGHKEKLHHDKGRPHSGHPPRPHRHHNSADNKHHNEGKDSGTAGSRSDEESPRRHVSEHHPHETKHKKHKTVKNHEVECQTEEVVEPVKQIVNDVITQTDSIQLNDSECQTDKIVLNEIGDVADSGFKHHKTNRDEKARRFSPRNVPSPLAYDSPDPFASPCPMYSEDELSVPSKIEVSISQKNSYDAEDGRPDVVLQLEEKIKSLTDNLAAASSTQAALENNCNALKEKLSFAEEVNLNQGVLFSLKLKERSLLLKELSNQVNILKNEGVKRENILQAQQAKVSPGLSIPLEQAGYMPRGRGDHSLNGTRNTIQPMLERPPSAPGLDVTPKGAWNIKFDDDRDARRPKTANAPMRSSPFTYNTPASSLLREAVPVSTLIKNRKVGSFTKGMSRSNSASGLSRQNPETALREACNLTQQKPDMFSSSGGKFGKARGGAVTAPATRQHSHATIHEPHDIFIEKSDDILVSSHDEIVEIRKRIGELLHDHDKLNQKRHEIEKGAAHAKPSSPGRQRSRSPLRGRPTSPPRIDQFMQFDRLQSAP